MNQNNFNSIFKTFVISILMIAQTHFAYSQTASILPPAKTTFNDANGNPLVNGKVEHYIPGTGTLKTTWQDAAETIPNTNPVVLDAAGRALILGDGSYRQVLKDRNGNVIWDAVTSSTGSGGGGGSTSTGDGDLVGTIKPWAGITAPNQYAFTYGQELSRTTFVALFTAITSLQAVFCTSGSPILNGLGDTSSFWVGMSLEVSCLGAGTTTVLSKTSTTVTMAANANVTTNTNARFFPWGRGNGTTTFNVPDFRGLIPVGNNIMGGVASSNINNTYFGAKLAESSGAQGGSTNGGSIALDSTNLPPITPTGTVDGTIDSQGFAQTGSQVTNGASLGSNNGGLVPRAWFHGTITINPIGGTSVPLGILPPVKTTNFIIKITPDTNSATASGVTSLGLMTGDIACGTGLLCTGNTISSTVSAGITGPGTTTDRAIATWNGTAGNALRENSKIGVAASGALTATPDGSATNVLNVPSNFATSSMFVGNGGSSLVHNAGTFTGTIAGTVLTVSAITTGTVPVERLATATLSGAGVTGGTQIRAQLTGPAGGAGTYTVSPSQTVGSPTAMTAISLQGYYNTMVGLTNFLSATTASYNVGVGFEVMEFCTTCFANTAIGEAALIYNIDGGGNTAVGWKALLGTPGVGFGDYNTAVGYSSGWAAGNAAGTTQNTSVGAFSLSAATLSGTLNAVLGYNAGGQITSGANNVAIGGNSASALTTGSNNTFIGPTSAGASVSTGSNNTIIGNCPAQASGTASTVILCDGGGVKAFQNNGATVQGSPANPTGTTSAVGVMMGLGGTCKITPSYSTRIKVEVLGNVSNSTISQTMTMKVAYGTGVAPANAAAASGTQIGNSNQVDSGTANFKYSIINGGIITGLTAGTAYWFDVNLATSGGTVAMINVSCNAYEF